MGGYHGFGPHMYRHHYRGSLKGKIIFFGVTLWLTSTVIAGVRRATGWTHNVHALTLTSAEDDDKRRKEWQKMMDKTLASSKQAAEARFQQLEQQYGHMIADEQTREQWRQWLAAEKDRLVSGWTRDNMWFQRNMDRIHGPDGHKCYRPGGFMGWYLGVGERTFDWFTRRVAGSRHFHWVNPQATGQAPAGIPPSPLAHPGPAGAPPYPFTSAGPAGTSPPPPPPPPGAAGHHHHFYPHPPPPSSFPNAFPGPLGVAAPAPFIASAPPVPAGMTALTDPASSSADAKTM